MIPSALCRKVKRSVPCAFSFSQCVTFPTLRKCVKKAKPRCGKLKNVFCIVIDESDEFYDIIFHSIN